MTTAQGPVPKFAIVGAGPAGFYAAEALDTECPGAEIDIVERLPTPYGLIRAGVAPDHQSTKTIQDAFEQIAQRPNVRIVGNVEVDRDVTIAELTQFYDAVVLASGAPDDAPLDVPGGDLPGVYGAAEFVGWYNAHPDHAGLDPLLDRDSVVVIGNGNVAIDIARILSKSTAELANSDIAAHAAGRLAQARISDVHIVGRRGPLEAKFTTVELRELGELAEAVAVAEPHQIPDAVGGDLPPRDRRVKGKNLECFKSFAQADPAAKARRIRFQFNARPLEVRGDGRVEAIRFERTRVENGQVAGTGETFEIACGAVVSAIGYRARALGGLAISATGDRLTNTDGRIAPGLYVVGWLRRGPSGKIGTNRTDAEEVAALIRSELVVGDKPGLAGLKPLLASRNVRTTDYVDWKKIEAAEIAAASGGKPRCKFATMHEMLAVLGA